MQNEFKQKFSTAARPARPSEAKLSGAGSTGVKKYSGCHSELKILLEHINIYTYTYTYTYVYTYIYRYIWLYPLEYACTQV